MKMKMKGFTLIELLAVIVILAIIALIATSIVLGIIDDTKESAMLRSAEMYITGVEHAIMKENMNNGGNFRPTNCDISNGSIKCDDKDLIPVEVDGEVPSDGTIVFENGKIKEVTLNYQSGTIVKDQNGDLVYSDDNNKDLDEELDLSTINLDLATNTWEEVYKVVSSGKAAEAGWKVGDTKTVTIDTDIDYDGTWESNTMTATLIGINHDGENTATFMIMERIGIRAINSESTNVGGWEASEIRAWLNSDVYNSMRDVKEYIKTVDKLTDNIGYSETALITDRLSKTQDKVFLLSPVEWGLTCPSSYSNYVDVFINEGTTYEWFMTNTVDASFWLRSPYSNDKSGFFYYEYSEFDKEGYISYDTVLSRDRVFPAFVIGK